MKNALALISHPTAAGIDGAFLESHYKSRARSGEQRLMLALLKDGIECFFRSLAATDRKGQELFEETDRWIFEQDGDWIFSFDNVCETLGVAPSYLRAKLRQQKESELTKGSGRKAA